MTLLDPIKRKLLDWRPDPHIETPSILDQTPWLCGFYEISAHRSIQYFNPGLVDWLGSRWLVARRRRTKMHPGKNDIVFLRLKTESVCANEHPIKFRSSVHDEHWEDPRVILFNGSPFVSYSNFRMSFRWVHQAIARIDTRFQAQDYHIEYETNGNALKENTGHQKNWTWFDYGGVLHFVYSPSPHVVVKSGPNGVAEEFLTPGFQWKYGLPRGGTPPVYVEEDGLYWSFFHSSLDISPMPPRRRYYMGAYAFEAWPPFRPVMATALPLLTGSGKDPRELSAPHCVFPCGALLDGGTWTVSFGVNDCACAWIKIPHQEIRRLSYTV